MQSINFEVPCRNTDKKRPRSPITDVGQSIVGVTRCRLGTADLSPAHTEAVLHQMSGELNVV